MCQTFAPQDYILQKAVVQIWLTHSTQCSLVTPYGDIDEVNTGSGNDLLLSRNQCWFLISEVGKYLPESNFTVNDQATILHNGFEKATFKITATSSSNQWINQSKFWKASYKKSYSIS